MLRLGTFLATCACVLIGTTSATAAVPQATLLPSGQAVAPPSAPPAVRSMIEAANRIRHRPYRWGGGHRDWRSVGYDCSGWSEYMRSGKGFRLRHPLGLLQAVPIS